MTASRTPSRPRSGRSARALLAVCVALAGLTVAGVPAAAQTADGDRGMAAAVPARAAEPVAPAAAPGDDGTTWGHGVVNEVPPDVFYARSGFMATRKNDSRGTCSSTLVGPSLIITASHCLNWKSGHVDSATVSLGYHREPKEGGGSRRVWLYRCAVNKAWTAGGFKMSSKDWAIARIGSCRKQGAKRNITGPVGNILGYDGVRVYKDDDTTTIFHGYPNTANGNLVKFLANPTGPSASVVAAIPVASKSLKRVTDYMLPAGGSGGPLLVSTSSPMVVAIANFNVEWSETYFRIVKSNIVEAVLDARDGTWPKGSWTLD